MALQTINMNGDLKQVLSELAFNKELQKQMNFFPCDENGKAIEQPQGGAIEEVKKKDVVVADVDKINDYQIDTVVIIPENSDIINPLDESPQPASEPKKRGRKPNQPKQ